MKLLTVWYDDFDDFDDMAKRVNDLFRAGHIKIISIQKKYLVVSGKEYDLKAIRPIYGEKGV